MEIRENQIQKINELINEGLVCQSFAIEGKKKYIEKVQQWLGEVCNENKESVPFWVWLISVPKIHIRSGEDYVENGEQFYSDRLKLCMQQLEDLRLNYYQRLELEYNREQAKNAQNSLKYTQKSLRISIYGLIISIIVPILISIITITCCTSSVKLDNSQYQDLKSILINDSLIYKIGNN